MGIFCSSRKFSAIGRLLILLLCCGAERRRRPCCWIPVSSAFRVSAPTPRHHRGQISSLLPRGTSGPGVDHGTGPTSLSFLPRTARRPESTQCRSSSSSDKQRLDSAASGDEDPEEEEELGSAAAAAAAAGDADISGVPAGSSSSSGGGSDSEKSRKRRIKKRLGNLARDMVMKPISYAAPVPQAIASVLKEATLGAVDMAVEEVANRRARKERNYSSGEGSSTSSRSVDSRNGGGESGKDELLSSVETDIADLIDEAFLPLELTLNEMEDSLKKARKSMEEAKSLASDALGAVQVAALAQVEGAATAVAAAEQKVIDDIFASVSTTDVESMTFEDVDYGTSEMAPPFLNEDQCLVPGEPVVRVEKAPQNSRRIFAGVDIMASVDDVWNVLTDYSNLQKVVPNLVVNDVLEVYDGADTADFVLDTSQPEEVQCREISKRMKGSLLKQVGGAKVAGINFSARTTLEVREWPQGMPDFAHFNDEVWEGKDRRQRAVEFSKVKLQRYRFPRPFAVSSLPTKDISMQSIDNDDGEFRMYQGVWRMQPLPGCSPPGQDAMRLTYAVEVSPRAYLPVQLIEGRIVRDLCTNLEAIRDFVSSNSAVQVT